MKRLAAVLFLAAILFVVLVIVPQLRQGALPGPSDAASADGPVDASSLLGTWPVDSESAWELVRTKSQAAKALAGLPPEALARAKAKFLTAVTASSCQFTTDKVIMLGPGGERRVDTYQVVSIVGNVLAVVSVDDKGKSHKITATLANDRLELTDPDKLGMELVFKRAP
jgi:hypothetical protein